MVTNPIPPTNHHHTPSTAFYEAGEIDKSFDVLNKLLTNAISESRFNDASYYSWLLANHFAFLAHDQTADKTNNNGTALERLRRAEDLHKNADMYYAYDIIHKYIVGTTVPEMDEITYDLL